MTITDRRIAMLEAALSPTERVVRWIIDAHAYGSFVAYVQATYARGPEALPLDRLAHEAAEAIRGARSRSTPETDEAVRAAVLSVVFRFQLVLRIIDVTERFQERAELVLLALTAGLNLAVEKDGKTGGGWPSLEVLRDTLFARVADLHTWGEARAKVEATYLAGQPALFPEARAAWADIVHRSRSMAMIAWGLTDHHGGAALDEDRYGPTDPVRVADHVRDLVEAAKVKALDEVGDGRRAVAVAMRWLRPTLGPSDEAPSQG